MHLGIWRLLRQAGQHLPSPDGDHRGAELSIGMTVFAQKLKAQTVQQDRHATARDHGDQQSEPQGQAADHSVVGNEGAGHKDGPVCQMEHLLHTQDQIEAQREQGVDRAGIQSVEDLLGDHVGPERKR